jgi:peptidoglycan glycosyltransferase
MDDLDRRHRLEHLFSDHASAVRAYAWRRVGATVADDVVSDVFVVAWPRLDHVPADALPWLLECARRLIANQLRADRRREALVERLGRERVPPLSQDGAVDSALFDALAAIGDHDREVLMLVAWEGLEPARAAVVMNCSQRAFAMRLHRARRPTARAMLATDPGRSDAMEALSDLLERLGAANPVPECDPPTIDDVWLKVSAPEIRPARRWAARSLVAFPGVASIAILTMVVIAIVVPLLGARHARSRPSAPAAGAPTLDAAAQAVAAQQLAGRAGAIAAIDPRTGAIRVLYGNPSSAVEYPPGGTFDVVSAAAGVDTGAYTPRSRIDGRSPLIVSGTPLHNSEGASYGPITLAQALQDSVTTVFAQVGEKVGREAIATYMRRFGFYAAPMPASGVRIDGRLAPPTDPRVDLGRVAIGRGGLSASPLQMAMVAAAVADLGKLMTPHETAGRPTLLARVMSAATARVLAQMMSDVVANGTATQLGLDGVRVAGKTGTADVGGGRADAWFIGFAPAAHPTIAIAVVLGHLRGGYGGTDAAPIARRMLQLLLATARHTDGLRPHSHRRG